MRRFSFYNFSGWGWLVAFSLSGAALLAQTVPEASVAAALRSLDARAAVAFVGNVVAVRRLGGVVEIEFAVEQQVKGEATGRYLLREWNGLWAAGQRRYWVGERALVFLRASGASGLSSPVDGLDGVLPVAVTGDLQAPQVDMERLRTRVARQAGTPMAEAGPQVRVDGLRAMLHGDGPRRPAWRVPLRGASPVYEDELLLQRDSVATRPFDGRNGGLALRNPQ